MNDWDASFYRRHTGFVSDLGQPVLDLLDPRPGERILDVGCGDGILAAQLVERGCEVVAIDTSPDMVAAAQGRGIDARLLDAVDLAAAAELDGGFDAVFSNAALHWMQPMDAVVRGMARVLRPSGRLVAELGGEGNIERIRSAIHKALQRHGIHGPDVDPWHFPSPDEYSGLLEACGFRVEFIEHFERPTELPTGMANWMESVGKPFLSAVPAGARQAFMSEVEDRLADVLRREDGTWWADYVRLRVRASRGSAA